MQGEWEKHYGSRWVKMFVRDENAFVSLGSNCLPEVQLIKNFGSWKGVSPDPEKSGYSHMPSLFDTGGVTPDALIEILNIIKCGGNPAIILGDISTYEGEVQKEGEVYYANKYIKGFTLTHEEENLDELKDNMSKRFDNFINSPKHTTFLWSNAQANFTPDLNSCGTTIKDYFLNKKRYDAICDLTFDLFQSNVKFAVRKEYVEDEMLLDLPNVYTVDIPFGTFNLFGTKKTFEEVFKDE